MLEGLILRGVSSAWNQIGQTCGGCIPRQHLAMLSTPQDEGLQWHSIESCNPRKMTLSYGSEVLSQNRSEDFLLSFVSCFESDIPIRKYDAVFSECHIDAPLQLLTCCAGQGQGNLRRTPALDHLRRTRAHLRRSQCAFWGGSGFRVGEF